MISKEKFIKIMDYFKNNEETFNELNKLLSRFDGDCYIAPGNTYNVVIDLLDEFFNEDQMELIEWWMWDREFGTHGNCKIYDKENNDIITDLITAEALYNYICSL